ncbi:MAG: hypothetical protein M9936_16230 [Caldilinea sp.]|nr:hypothetical protein [Caldilinea sp.]
MTMELQLGINRILLLGIFALIFGGWGLYWYRHAADLDRYMTRDWLGKAMRIEDKMPKERRVAAFRKQAMTMIALALLLTLWFVVDLVRLIQPLWK